MGIAFELYFDEESDEIIKSVWKNIEENNIPSFMYRSNSKPHISLSVYNEIDINKANILLKNYSMNHKKINVFLLFLGSFLSQENVVFFAPKENEELTKFHKEFHEEFKSFQAEVWEYYLPGKWQPHCTLDIESTEDNFQKVFMILKNSLKPMKVIISTIGIVEFKPVKLLYEYELQ